MASNFNIHVFWGFRLSSYSSKLIPRLSRSRLLELSPILLEDHWNPRTTFSSLFQKINNMEGFFLFVAPTGSYNSARPYPNPTGLFLALLNLTNKKMSIKKTAKKIPFNLNLYKKDFSGGLAILRKKTTRLQLNWSNFNWLHFDFDKVFNWKWICTILNNSQIIIFYSLQFNIVLLKANWSDFTRHSHEYIHKEENIHETILKKDDNTHRSIA